MVGIPAGIFHSMFSIVNMEKFDLSPEVNGYILTYIGLLTAVGSQTTDIEIAYFEIACIIIFVCIGLPGVFLYVNVNMHIACFLHVFNKMLIIFLGHARCRY